jgi:hypothetical protein
MSTVKHDKDDNDSKKAGDGDTRKIIESQREITNSFQSAWSSFFDNYFWISPKRITETHARTVSSISDSTIAAIRMCNGTTLATTETMRVSIEYMRDNARETSRVAINGAKMLEEATYFPTRKENP